MSTTNSDGQWITVNGRHILLKNGETPLPDYKKTKEEDLVSRQQQQIKANQKVAEMLNRQRTSSHKSTSVIDKGTQKSLQEGNEYAFAHQLLKSHPDFAKKEGFDFDKAVNHYKTYVEYNKDSKYFVFIGKKGKYFFDTNMKFIGSKMW